MTMDFKIAVTPQESHIVQEVTGTHLKGIMWKCIPHFLYFEQGDLFVGFDRKDFKEDHLKEISFCEFSSSFDNYPIMYE